ncbi:MAG: hypothetical protein KGL53_07855 [Elusimicrobia bacterium]|nr:hypothetical protein [Elusimicrobiota bacterium]
MPPYGEFRYSTKPDLLGGGTTFRYELTARGGSTSEVVVSTDEDNLPANLRRNATPEARAFYLFPAFRRRLERYLDGLDRPPRGRQDLRVPAGELRELLGEIELPPLDMVRTFVYISNENIFADRDVPLSTRIVSAETGLTREAVRRAVADSADLEIVEEDFLRARRPLDL